MKTNISFLSIIIEICIIIKICDDEVLPDYVENRFVDDYDRDDDDPDWRGT